jgi:fructokinase
MRENRCDLRQTSDMKDQSVWVCGEALIDLIPISTGERVPMVGGGPANTAKAIARLGYQTFFIGGISSDEYGNAIEDELASSGVDLTLAYGGDEPTALAIATIDSEGLARYDFELEGTASFAFDRSWLAMGNPEVLHVGSVATLIEPGASELLKWVSTKSAPVIFDPNIRPSIEGNRDIYRAAVERWIDVSTVVKLSEDDLNFLYGDKADSVIDELLSRGVSIVVVTRAEKGLSAFSAGWVVEVPAVKVDVVDTVGAGDTIGAVLVEGVLLHGIANLSRDTLKLVLERAAKAAAITCSRAGANPPSREELEAI